MQQEPVVEEAITYVAIDDSARKLSVAVLNPGEQEPVVFTIDNDRATVRKHAKKWLARAKGPVVACYEAGPLGFELWRWLESDGIACRVAAPSQTPRRVGQRVKTDSRDARKLVKLFRAGELTWVRAPEAAEEAARDLVRYVSATRADALRIYNRVGKFLLRHGRHWKAQGRTKAHRRWLDAQHFDEPILQQVLEEYMYAIGQAEARLLRAEAELARLAQTEKYAEKVGWLCCLRGVNVTLAMIILTELHGFERFTKPRQLMAFLGLVPSEYSTGERQRQGAITKTGSPHVRWALVQMAHSLRHPPGRSRTIGARRVGQPARVVGIAERAEQREHDRFKRLKRRGKEYNKITVALAREQVGFIWAILTPHAS